MLGRINLARIPRERRQYLAQICRRAGLIDRGLRVLHPIVRLPRPGEAPPSPGELCEYAVLLSRNGSIREAITLLNSSDAAMAPDARLYLGFCHVSNWDYADAVNDFTAFLESGPEDYIRLVAQVNLVAALIATERYSKAKSLIHRSLPAARAPPPDARRKLTWNFWPRFIFTNETSVVRAKPWKRERGSSVRAAAATIAFSSTSGTHT
ncbi:MAG: hypothetical protein HC902_04610 [Calothrix sp. SM1_5_4]|nr:hypothetical protein [Calothrix sp. SM1_5_4]